MISIDKLVVNISAALHPNTTLHEGTLTLSLYQCSDSSYIQIPSTFSFLSTISLTLCICLFTIFRQKKVSSPDVADFITEFNALNDCLPSPNLVKCTTHIGSERARRLVEDYVSVFIEEGVDIAYTLPWVNYTVPEFSVNQTSRGNEAVNSLTDDLSALNTRSLRPKQRKQTRKKRKGTSQRSRGTHVGSFLIVCPSITCSLVSLVDMQRNDI